MNEIDMSVLEIGWYNVRLKSNKRKEEDLEIANES